ncbi:MAG: zinc-ribbon domain-containing protein [Promethearchaeota archaeon]|nr:MAG: zinc-ribbon domain-containing protein [Candidatus Lokiarchaeota archaeon]
MTNYCPNCGTRVEPTWNACPNCGSVLEKDMIQESRPLPTEQPYSQQYQQPVVRKVKTTNGTISLIFGIIGLVTCCFGLIFGIIAIYYGNKGLKEDDDKTLSQIGLILGIIDFVCCTCYLILFIPLLLYY